MKIGPLAAELCLAQKSAKNKQRGLGLKFDAKEFKSRFPNAKSISTERWKHGFLAFYEIMITYTFDVKTNWTRYVPFLLGKLGVYQGWLNADEIIDQRKFVSSRYEYKPLGTVADLLKNTSNRAKPIAPALVYDPKKMDGTATPSTQSSDRNGKCHKIQMDNLSFSEVSLVKTIIISNIMVMFRLSRRICTT